MLRSSEIAISKKKVQFHHYFSVCKNKKECIIYAICVGSLSLITKDAAVILRNCLILYKSLPSAPPSGGKGKNTKGEESLQVKHKKSQHFPAVHNKRTLPISHGAEKLF